MTDETSSAQTDHSTKRHEAPLAHRAIRSGMWILGASYWTIGFGFIANIGLTRLLTPGYYYAWPHHQAELAAFGERYGKVSRDLLAYKQAPTAAECTRFEDAFDTLVETESGYVAPPPPNSVWGSFTLPPRPHGQAGDHPQLRRAHSLPGQCRRAIGDLIQYFGRGSHKWGTPVIGWLWGCWRLCCS